jgi:hypothetical protein
MLSRVVDVELRNLGDYVIRRKGLTCRSFGFEIDVNVDERAPSIDISGRARKLQASILDKVLLDFTAGNTHSYAVVIDKSSLHVGTRRGILRLAAAD